MATPLTVPIKINNLSIIIEYYGNTGKKWSSFAYAYDQSTLESLTSLFSVSGSVVTYDSKTLKYNNVDVVPSDTIVDNGEYVTLIEPQDPIETSIKIGTKSLADASVGTTKLLKAYIGNHLIFERLGSNFLTSDGKILQTQDGNVFNVQEESGFTVSGTNDSSAYAKPYYSTDNGSTWIEIPRGSFTLPAMTTFKLKIGGYADNLMSATSTQLGLSLPLVETTIQISNNYILTQNITDLTIHRETA